MTIMSTPNTPLHTSRLFVLWIITGSIASSVAIVMVNKYVLTNGFPNATSLTALHQLSGYLFTLLLPLPPTPHLPLFDASLLGISYASGLVLMNQSLKQNPISIYQLLKMACIPTIAFLQLLYGLPIPVLTAISLFVILLGVSLSTLTDPSLTDPSNLLVGVLGVIATSLSQVWLQARPSVKGLSGFQTIAVTAPYAFIVCALTALVCDVEWEELSDGIWMNSLNDGMATDTLIEDMWSITNKIFQAIPIPAIILSCLLSILTNYFGFALIQTTSAMTYQVVGHSKTILTILIGGLMFGASSESVSTQKLAGIVITFLGVILYSYSKSKKTIKQEKKVQ